MIAATPPTSLSPPALPRQRANQAHVRRLSAIASAVAVALTGMSAAYAQPVGAPVTPADSTPAGSVQRIVPDSTPTQSRKSSAATADVPQEVAELPAVTVTAEKVTATEQKVPISMTVLTGEQLERSATRGTADVVRQVPNMYMTKAGQHADVAFFSMRGITPYMEAEQPIGFFVDGVHYRFVDLDLLDIDRVEVLRGPQSTLYGRNTEAGAVNVITRDPEPFREGTLSLDVGNYGLKKASAILGGPLGGGGGGGGPGDGKPDWSWRLAVQGLHSNGYLTQEPSGKNDVARARDYGARFKLRYNPSSTWDVVASYDGQRYRDGSTNIAPLSTLYTQPGKVFSNYIDLREANTHSGNIRAIYRAPSFTLTAITAATREAHKAGYDVDASALDFMRLKTDVRYSRFSQELRINSPEEGSGLRWLGGLYYFNQNDTNAFDMNMSGMGFGVQSVSTQTRTRNMAAFGQVSWPLSTQFSLVTGLRYDHEQKHADNRQTWAAMGRDMTDHRDMTFSAWLPKIGIEYRPTPNLMAYASLSRGYKAGGYNNLADAGHEVYNAEYTRNYEIGLKHTSEDKRLQTRLALFQIDWTNQQVEELVLTQSNLKNAGKSRSQGIEAEAAWQATKALTLRAGVGWNNARFVQYVYGGQDLAGKRPPNAPALTYNLGADYRFGNGFYAHAGWQANGPVYFDSANQHRQSGYGLLNLKVGQQFRNYDWSLWARNATGKAYATRAFDIGGGTYAGIAGEPRTFGINLTVRW